MRINRRHILAIAVGGLFGLACAELFLRLLGFPASNIYRVDETGLLTLNPSAHIRVASACFKNTVETNTLGFHAKEYLKAKPSDVFRIAIIGDSFVEAVHVPLEETFSSLLEKRLNELPNRRYRYEVIPFGVSSHGTYGNAQLFTAYASAFHPDVVINLFVTNDVEDDLAVPASRQSAIELPPPPSASFLTSIKKIARSSVLVTTLRRAYQTVAKRGSIVDNAPQSAPLTYQIFAVQPPAEIKEGWRREALFLDLLQRAVRDNGGRLVVISATDGYRVHEDLRQDFLARYSDAQGFDFTKLERELSRITQSLALPYIPLNPVFADRAQRKSDRTVWSCDGHWNATGHQWAAEAMAQALTQRHLIGN